MNRLFKRVLDRGLFINERLLATADNAVDWMLMRESLVKSGMTPYDTVYQGDPMSVRYYPPPSDSWIEMAGGERVPVAPQRFPVPLVLVPPLGVTTEVFDLMPHRSLVRYMAARGFHVYLIDWGKPERRHATLSMKDYAVTMFDTALEEVRRHADIEDVSVMGWCMGGLLSLLHTGLERDHHIQNLITVASPIDLRGGGLVARAATALNTPARLIRKFSDWRLHSLDPSKLHAPGWLTTLGFKLTDPIGSITTYWDLLTRLWDREFVENYSTTADYLNNMLEYPGGVIQDMVIKFAIDNQMAAGRVEFRGTVADMSLIEANFLVFAGDTDILVPPEIARRSVELVSSQDREFHVVPGGHMGVILGSKALKSVWAPSADWLSTRSDSSNRRGEGPSAADLAVQDARFRRQAEDPTW
ncbi:alpha/beta fold hydrolase [Alcanivorax sp. JB21]|uniref:alpha/beta fold hydrolase n=1 Tax=Alcanivorax limicola TaxID=2874102 RepID=UPI001CBEC31A|nr:alpha/beta fold hydrolase [Alcanivorax limicola]MBZ2187900.1 alpha/beta fold hydrolase [Alcanivorax limicola]